MMPMFIDHQQCGKVSISRSVAAAAASAAAALAVPPWPLAPWPVPPWALAPWPAAARAIESSSRRPSVQS